MLSYETYLEYTVAVVRYIKHCVDGANITRRNHIIMGHCYQLQGTGCNFKF